MEAPKPLWPHPVLRPVSVHRNCDHGKKFGPWIIDLKARAGNDESYSRNTYSEARRAAQNLLAYCALLLPGDFPISVDDTRPDFSIVKAREGSVGIE